MPPKVVWAKVVGHPFWPARLCEASEGDAQIRHRQRKSDVLVHFFAADEAGRSFGWIIPSNVKDFPGDDSDFSKTKNSKLRDAFAAAVDFCDRIARGETFDFSAPPDDTRELDGGTCAICARDEAAGTILLCEQCNGEYHMGCLDPPCAVIPDGDWLCPSCNPSAFASTTNRKRAIIGAAPVEAGAPPKPKKRRDARSRPRVSASAARAPPDVDESEDNCLVCNAEGDLLLCDFSGCTKVSDGHASIKIQVQVYCCSYRELADVWFCIYLCMCSHDLARVYAWAGFPQVLRLARELQRRKQRALAVPTPQLHVVLCSRDTGQTRKQVLAVHYLVLHGLPAWGLAKCQVPPLLQPDPASGIGHSFAEGVVQSGQPLPGRAVHAPITLAGRRASCGWWR